MCFSFSLVQLNLEICVTNDFHTTVTKRFFFFKKLISMRGVRDSLF